MLSKQGDFGSFDAEIARSLVVRGNVAEITNVAFLALQPSVPLIEWIVMGSRRRAPIGKISELMDVYAMLVIRFESSHCRNNLRGSSNGILAERHNAFDFGVVWIEDTNGVSDKAAGRIICFCGEASHRSEEYASHGKSA